MMHVNTKQLKQAVKDCQKVMHKGKSTWPILECIKVEIRHKDIQLTATDLECGYRATVDAKVSSDLIGKAFCVNPKDLALMLTGDVSEIGLQQPGFVHVDSGRLNTVDVEKFPSGVLDTFALNAASVYNVPGFSECLGLVAHAQSTDECRFNICGVSVECDGQTVDFAAIDGHRCAYILAQPSTGPKGKYIIPSKAVDVLKGLDLGLFAIGTQDNIGGAWLRVSTPNGWFVTRLVDGQFPNWRQLITSISGTAEFEAKDLLNQLQPFKLLAPKKRKGVYHVGLKITHNCTETSISCSSAEKGNVKTVIDSRNDKAPEKSFGLSLGLLSDAVKAQGSKRVTFAHGNTESFQPVTIHSDGPMRELIMPMRFE